MKKMLLCLVMVCFVAPDVISAESNTTKQSSVKVVKVKKKHKKYKATKIPN